LGNGSVRLGWGFGSEVADRNGASRVEKPVLGFGFPLLASERPPSRPPPRLSRRIKAGHVPPPKRVFDLHNYAEHNGASAEWLAQAELKGGGCHPAGWENNGRLLRGARPGSGGG